MAHEKEREMIPHRETPDKPAGKGGDKPVSNVGNETKAQVKATQMGGSMAEAGRGGLAGAMDELHAQHPHGYDDHGPHHGTTDHVRHMPLHGLKK